MLSDFADGVFYHKVPYLYSTNLTWYSIAGDTEEYYVELRKTKVTIATRHDVSI